MKKKKIKKALIIGIDGLPYELLQSLLDRGCMEGLKEILTSGYVLYKMNASLPDISSVSWTSFMTGENPAEHGIFGFTELKKNTYELKFPNAKDIKAPFFWQRLRDKNLIKNSIIVNIPNTYPAFPIDGILISGFVAIDFEKAVYPKEYIPFLNNMNYIIDVDLLKAREDRFGFYKDLIESLKIREKVSKKLAMDEDWDIAVFCITETDRLHHFFYSEKDENLFDEFYKEIDSFIVSIFETAIQKYGDDILFIIISDHGFDKLNTEVNLNAYLIESGILKIDKTKEFYEKIDKGTIAFAMDPGRICINYKEKFPKGSIKNKEAERIKKVLKDVLFNLKDDKGIQIIKHIFEKEEIYRGRFLDQAPDLICIPNRGFDLKGNMRKEKVFTNDIFEGMHTWDNAILIAPKEIKIENVINIEYPSKIVCSYFEGN